MNSAFFPSLLAVAFTGAVMLLLPHLSPRRYFFAISVAPGFPMSEPGRASLRRYHWMVACAIVISVLPALAMGESAPDVAMLSPMLVPMFLGMGAYLLERNRVRRHATPPPDVREVDLSAGDDRLPRWIFLALPPFLAPAATALYLRAHWEEIPSRFPIHWGLHGADRWADKTTHGVYGPLLYSAGMMLLMLLLTIATFFGARRSAQRGVMLKLMVLVTYLFAVLFAGIGLSPLIGFHPAWIFVSLPIFIVPGMVWMYKVVRDPKFPGEATPDECWYLGSLYVNAEDPAIFVQKRVGLGYTFNLGNRWSWVIVGGFMAGMLGLVFTIR